jgi:hypothetical protein
VVLWWRILASTLYWLHQRQDWRPAGWVLRVGTQRPWFGFTLGTVLAVAVAFLAVQLLR